MKCFNKLWELFVILCYIYGSLATAYAGTIRSVKHERSTSQFSQRCVLCSRVLPSLRKHVNQLKVYCRSSHIYSIQNRIPMTFITRMKRVDGHVLALAPVDVCARSSGRSAHTSNYTLYDLIHGQKILSETYMNPEEVFVAQKYSVIRPTLVMFSTRIQLVSSVNSSECMK